ncbi:hypothetical protein ACFXDP_06345 [Streptomyces sp. NPDC059374]|uniref:hypothetical protein n=1 Tax=Streptomyces sp. NPDC059374 TaxID=3346814 RepID=UPI0036D0F51C
MMKTIRTKALVISDSSTTSEDGQSTMHTQHPLHSTEAVKADLTYASTEIGNNPEVAMACSGGILQLTNWH